MNKVLDN